MSSAHLRNEVTRNPATPHPRLLIARRSRAPKKSRIARRVHRNAGKKRVLKSFVVFLLRFFARRRRRRRTSSSSFSSSLLIWFMSKGSLIKMERKKSTEIKLHTEARLYESIEKEALFFSPLFFCFFVFYESLNSLVCSLRPRKFVLVHKKTEKKISFFFVFFSLFYKKRVFKEKALSRRKRLCKTRGE